MTTKQDQIEIVKFLKSATYQETLKKYGNKYIAKYEKFEDMYMGEDYKSGEPEYSEIAMQAGKRKIFLNRIKDVKGDSRGAVLVRELLEQQANNIKSQYMNTVTNSFGGSKDLAVFTEEDMFKFEMLHDKDFHIYIVGMMCNIEGQSIEEKYEVFDTIDDIRKEGEL